MATTIPPKANDTTNATQSQPLIVGCEESEERQTLPTLVEWRERESAR